MSEKKSIKAIAFIPARSGSKRVVDKNIRQLNGHPLIAYTISAAKQSGAFDSVVVATDSEKYADIARHYGAEVPFLRSEEISDSKSPDIEWVLYALAELEKQNRSYDCFSILRPTSPFRQPETIQRAMLQFLNEDGVDSLRAVELCKQHPGKMWKIEGTRMSPIMPHMLNGHPWHSSQYAALPEIYVQNASLEIAWVSAVSETNSISGKIVMPFLTEGIEGEDINDEYDWQYCQKLTDGRSDILPEIKYSPYQF